MDVRSRVRIILPLLLVLTGVCSGVLYARDDARQAGDILAAIPPGGVSASTVIVEPVHHALLEYRFLRGDREGDTDHFIPLVEPLRLSAPDGLRVVYHLEFQYRDVRETRSWVIDRRVLPPPLPDPFPGTYTEPLTVTFQGESTVLYSDRGTAPVQRFPEKGIELAGEPGAVQRYTIVVLQENDAGVRGTPGEYTYILDRSAEASPRDDIILSPRPGRFGNEQNLIVDTTGLRDVRIAVRRFDRLVEEPFIYEGPVTIEGDGTFSLVLEAIARQSGEPVRREVRWEQDSREVWFPAVAASPVPLTVPVPPGEARRYRVDDNQVTATDPLLIHPLTLVPVPAADRVAVIRLAAAPGSREERYAVLLQGRIPDPPSVFVSTGDGSPDGSRALHLYSAAGTEIRYIAGEQEFVYSEAIPCDSPAFPAEGFTVQGRYPGGSWSIPRHVEVDPAWCPGPGELVALAVTYRSGTQLNDTLTLSGPERSSVGGESSAPPGEVRGGTVLVDVRDEAGEPFLSGSIPWNHRISLELSAGIRRSVFPRGARESSVHVDTAPGAPPVVTVEGTRVTLTPGDESELPLFWRVDGGTAREYREPIVLEGFADTRVVYHLEAFSRERERRGVSAREAVVIDRRIPAVPPFRVPEASFRGNQSWITSADHLVVEFQNPHDDLELYYEVTDTGTPTDPTPSSAVTRNEIRIPLEENTDTTYYIAVRARFSRREEWSPVARLSVRGDRIPPPSPVVEYPPEDVVTSRSQVVRLHVPPSETEDAGETALFFRFSQDEEYQRWTGPVVIAPPAEGVREVVIQGYTEDLAGNRTTLAEERRISLGNPPSTPPEVLFDGRRITRRNGEFHREGILDLNAAAFLEARHLELYWRISSAGDDTQEMPFLRYEEPRVLSFPDSQEFKVYRVEAFLEDERFGRGPVAEHLIALDRRRPPVAPPPVVRYAGDGRRGTLDWTGLDLDRVFVAVTSPGGPGGTLLEGRFQPVQTTMDWEMPAGTDRVVVAWFSRSAAGERSDTSTLEITPARRLAGPQVSGVNDGGVYNETRHVTINAQGLPVRLSVSTDGQEPPAVTRFSSRYSETLSFDVPRGETLPVVIRARAENPDGTLSPETRVSFRLDRTVPPPPVITGVEAHQVYDGPQQVSFEAPEGTHVWYRVREQRDDADGEFRLWDGQVVVLPAIPRRTMEYRVEAYTRSAAGNRSQEIQAVSLWVDRNMVHVYRGASVGGDGSRSRPVATLSEGLAVARRQQRGLLLVGPGEYYLDSTLAQTVVDDLSELVILGQRDPHNWGTGEGPTVIFAEREADRKQLDLSLPPGRTLVFRHVSVGHPLTLRGGGTVRVEGSSLGGTTIHRGTITLTDSDVAGRIALEEGALLRAVDSRIRPPHHTARATSPLISVRRGTLELQNTLVIREGAHRAPVIRGVQANITATDSAVISRGGNLEYGLALRDSTVDISGSLIAVETRDVTSEGVAVAAVGGELTLRNSTVVLFGSGNPDALHMVNGDHRTVIRSMNTVFLSDFENDLETVVFHTDRDTEMSVNGNLFLGTATLMSTTPVQGQWQRRRTVQSIQELQQLTGGRDNELRDLPPERDGSRNEIASALQEEDAAMVVRGIQEFVSATGSLPTEY